METTKTINGVNDPKIFIHDGHCCLKGTTKIFKITEELKEGDTIEKVQNNEFFEWSDPIETIELLVEAVDFYDKVI